MIRLLVLSLAALLLAGCATVSVQSLHGLAGPARDVCLD